MFSLLYACDFQSQALAGYIFVENVASIPASLFRFLLPCLSSRLRRLCRTRLPLFRPTYLANEAGAVREDLSRFPQLTIHYCRFLLMRLAVVKSCRARSSVAAAFST